jgi:hypothetical protein
MAKKLIGHFPGILWIFYLSEYLEFNIQAHLVITGF